MHVQLRGQFIKFYGLALVLIPNKLAKLNVLMYYSNVCGYSGN